MYNRAQLDFDCWLVIHIESDWLFQWMTNLRKNVWIHVASWVACAAAMYLASVDERETVICFFDDQLIAAPEIIAVYPEIDFTSLGSLAQSASQ